MREKATSKREKTGTKLQTSLVRVLLLYAIEWAVLYLILHAVNLTKSVSFDQI